jgi:hypothetical protein
MSNQEEDKTQAQKEQNQKIESLKTGSSKLTLTFLKPATAT